MHRLTRLYTFPCATQQQWALTRWQIDLPVAVGGDAPAAAAASGVSPSVNLEFAAADNAGAAGAPDASATRAVALTTDAATLKLLLHELKQARQAMQTASET
jgi:hypothetical protein